MGNREKVQQITGSRRTMIFICLIVSGIASLCGKRDFQHGTVPGDDGLLRDDASVCPGCDGMFRGYLRACHLAGIVGHRCGQPVCGENL